MVPELLEHVFLQSSLPDLLARIPRVCKHWKATIDCSVKLQRALFFQKSGDIVLEEHRGEEATYSVRGTINFWYCPVIANPFLWDLSNDFTMDWPGSQALKHPQASWRRMLVTQPPIASVSYHSPWCVCPIVHYAEKEERCAWATSPRCKEGTILGHVLGGNECPKDMQMWNDVQVESAAEMVQYLSMGLSRRAPATSLLRARCEVLWRY